MYFAISVDLVRSQYILWDLSRSCEISADLMRSQLCFYPRSLHTKVPFQEIRHFPSCVDLRARSIGLYPHHRYRLVPVQCPYPLIWGSSQCLVVSSLSGRAAAPLSWASGHVSEARPPYPRYQTPSQPPGPTSPLFPETDVIRILNRQHQHQHSLWHVGREANSCRAKIWIRKRYWNKRDNVHAMMWIYMTCYVFSWHCMICFWEGRGCGHNQTNDQFCRQIVI